MKRPGYLRRLGLTTLALASLATGRAQVIFGSDVSSETLVTFNGTTLTGTVNGSISTDTTGLAWDSVHSVLYGIASSSLWSINPANGNSVFVTGIATGGNPNGLAYDPALNRLFISDNNSNGLFSFSLGTSTLSLIGTIGGGFTSVEGLGYDASTGTLFGLADDQDQIINIDTNDASAVGLPNMLVAGTWRGLDFDPASGRLLATRVGVNQLTSIDPITGIGTDLGPITGAGSFTFIQGLAVQSAIPEPAHATLLLAFVGMALAASARRRCRE